MKYKLLTLLVLSLFILMMFSASAMAQQAQCGNVTFTLTPSQGAAGSQVAASASGLMNGSSFNIYWGSATGAVLASGNAIGGNVNENITIPGGAAAGMYSVVLTGTNPQEGGVECSQPFTVVAAVAEEETGVRKDAYTAVSALPSTGAFLLPAAGLSAAGAGILYLRRRK